MKSKINDNHTLSDEPRLGVMVFPKENLRQEPTLKTAPKKVTRFVKENPNHAISKKKVGEDKLEENRVEGIEEHKRFQKRIAYVLDKERVLKLQKYKDETDKLMGLFVLSVFGFAIVLYLFMAFS
ncbi:hypothetical protein AAEX37_01795 [Oligella sp. MSHR50489EDL]|uniref:hypothetical protein n=1 Tax=Oligella sp. MSHR50489EDL TaxID=3139409 RepID=UPI003D8147A3